MKLVTLFIFCCEIIISSQFTPIKKELSTGRYGVGSVSVGKYALFGGGIDISGMASSRVDIYNVESKNWTTAELSTPRHPTAVASVGKYAMFAGGREGLSFGSSSRIDVFNSETGQWTQKQLSIARFYVSGTSVGRFAVFAGGYDTSHLSRVDIYDPESGVMNITELSEKRYLPLATTIGPYAVFACGHNYSGVSSVIDLINPETMSGTTISFPREPRTSMTLTSNGTIAIFAGGRSNETIPVAHVDIYNHETGEWTTDELGNPKYDASSTTLGKYAVFGGENLIIAVPLNIEIYNYETKEWMTTDMSIPRILAAATSVGSFFMFAGGAILGGEFAVYSSRVDIFQICAFDSDCTDDGTFCTDTICSGGWCDFNLDHCRNGAECNNVCNEEDKTCFRPVGTACGGSWCAGNVCDGIGTCSYTKPRCSYNDTIAIACRLCDSVRESCYSPEGEPCLLTNGEPGVCNEIGHCTEKIVKESKSTDIRLIIGLIVSGLVVVSIMIGVVIYIRRRKRKDGSHSPQTLEMVSSLSGIEIEYKLGGGNFGEVYKGTRNGTTPVALKKLKDQTQTKEFEQEATMLQSLQHPNIVRYLGIYRAPDNILYIVTEFISDGSLLTVIHQNKGKFDVSKLKLFAAQAASGMAFLESKGIIHRDLSLRNLLASKRDSNNSYEIFVSDFGLSRVAEGGYYRSSDNHIPVKWSAPESIEYGFFTSKSDTWSFGILLWELFSGGKQPYAAIANNEILDKLNEGYRLPQPENCPLQIYELMLKCWSQKPEDRPTFQGIHTILSTGAEIVPTHFPSSESNSYLYHT